tara:strand:+ start:92 stop:211 length:120 start_codon:yes stop_codon:yes gene_type:complete
MEIVTHLAVYFAGLLTGMYFVTQIEKHIDKNIKNKEDDK